MLDYKPSNNNYPVCNCVSIMLVLSSKLLSNGEILAYVSDTSVLLNLEHSTVWAKPPPPANLVYEESYTPKCNLK